MDHLEDRFEVEKREQAEALRRQHQMEDLAAELGGYDNGRSHHILSSETQEIIKGERNGKGGHRLSALELALLNAKYAELFRAAETENREAQQRTGQFRDKAENAIERMQREIDMTLDAAITLPNGKKAFMNKRGEVRTVDGEPVDQAIVDGIDWSGRPCLEHYRDQLHRMERLKGLAHEGDMLSLRLGEIDNELHDQDEPPTKDEIEEYREEMKSMTDHIGELDREMDSLLSPDHSAKPIKHDVSAVRNANVVPSL